VGSRKRFKSGQVVWASKIPDRNGVAKDQARPLLVIRPDPVSVQSPLCCLAISTEPSGDPSSPAIEMPWDARTGDTTGLYKWCRVVLLWHVLVDPQNVEEVSGLVTPSFLERVMTERESALLWRRR
jgi:hypothetical protein